MEGKQAGHSYKVIAMRLPGRTTDAVMRHWHRNLKHRQVLHSVSNKPKLDVEREIGCQTFSTGIFYAHFDLDTEVGPPFDEGPPPAKRQRVDELGGDDYLYAVRRPGVMGSH